MSSVEMKFQVSARPNWTEVSLSALQENYRIIANHVAPAEVCAVVKCDAYGHGTVECSRALEAKGASWFGVTSAEEGERLRMAGISGRILLMTGFWRGEEDAVIANRLTPAVWTSEHIERLECAAKSLKLGEKVPVHLKVDTGMARLGLPLSDVEGFARRIAASSEVRLEGVFSHLASSEELESEHTQAQIACFRRVGEILRSAGTEPRYRHLANTAAIVGRSNTWENMVRPGLVLYGCNVPFTAPADFDETRIPRLLPVIPILSWKTRIISLRDFPTGQPVGYNGTYVTQSPSRIAVISVGYGDGFFRAMSNRGRVIVRGRYAPLIGNVSMDLTMIDVTGIDGAEIGDEVILIGSSGPCTVTMLDHARWAGTIPYEVVCRIARRVPRIYLD